MKLKVLIQPNARKTEVVGRHADGIKIRVQAPPVEGAANEALIRFLSDVLNIPRRDIEITHGHSSRTKLLEIRTDWNSEDLRARLCQDT